MHEIEFVTASYCRACLLYLAIADHINQTPTLIALIIDMKVTKLHHDPSTLRNKRMKVSKKLEVKLELLKLCDPCKLWIAFG